LLARESKKIIFVASYLSDAPWPATKDELIDYAIRTGAPLEVVENLQAIEDEAIEAFFLRKLRHQNIEKQLWGF